LAGEWHTDDAAECKLAAAAHDTLQGRDVGEVLAAGDNDVFLVGGEEVVRRISLDPPISRSRVRTELVAPRISFNGT
jgi:hypothetical protein